MIAVLSLMVALRAPDGISFSRPPSRLERLLPELSKVVGQELAGAGDVLDDVLVVSVRDVSSGDLLKKIEGVTGATWVKTETGSRLELTAEAKAKEAGEALAEDTRVLKLAIDAFSGEPNPMRAGDPDFDRPPSNTFIGPDGMSPHDGPWLDKALQAIMPMLSVDELAKARDGRLVFALKPNAMQRPLPAEAEAPIQAAIAAQNAWAVGKPKTGKSFSGYDIPSTLDSKSARVLLVINADDFPRYKLHLRFANEKGVVVGAADKELIPVPDAEREAAATKLLRDEGLQKPLVLDGDAAATFGLLEKITAKDFTTVKAEEPLRKRMVDSISFDPLSFSIAQGFQGVGDKLGRNVVALLPDSFFDKTLTYVPTMQERLGGGNPLYATFLYDAVKDGMVIDSGEGWIVGRPSNRLRYRVARSDRKLLSRLFATISGRTLLSLDEVYALTASGRQVVEPFSMLASLIHPPFHPYNPFESRGAVELVGRLSAAQRSRLDDGIRFDTLPQGVRTALANAIFQTRAGVSVDDPEAQPDPERGEYRGFRGQSERLAVEPTIALPKGIPSNAMLTGTIETHPAVVPSEWVERQDPRYGRVTDAKGMVKCARVSITLTLELAPGVHTTWTSDFKAR